MNEDRSKKKSPRSIKTDKKVKSRVFIQNKKSHLLNFVAVSVADCNVYVRLELLTESHLTAATDRALDALRLARHTSIHAAINNGTIYVKN